MKKLKKTYAIFHLTEKHTVFYLGKTKVHVSFTGGIVTKKGVTPATFTTEDPIVQLAIENSADYKKGAIKLRSQYPVKGEVRVGKNTTAPPAPSSVSATSAGDIAETETGPEEEFICLQKTETTEDVTEETTGEVIEEATEDVTEESKLEEIDASCKDVAKQYLQEHFGENPSPLRTRQDVQDCAARHGITFKFV